MPHDDPNPSFVPHGPCIGFAHRGARAYAPENTMESFQLALRLGATGLESDVWLTSDKTPVLDHDGVVRRTLRSRPLRNVSLAELPEYIPALENLLVEVPASVPISLDIKDVEAFGPSFDVCKSTRPQNLSDVYFCHPDIDILEGERERCREVAFVSSTRLVRMKKGPEVHAARLRESKIEVVNMPYVDWSGGLVALFHRFGIRCFAWDCQQPEQIRTVHRMGVDGIYSDWPDRLVDELLL